MRIQVKKPYLQSNAGLLFVIVAHASVIYWQLQQSIKPVLQANQAKPMLVSLIGPPAPALAQMVEPQAKKAVEKIKPNHIKPIEKPAEKLVELSPELAQEPIKNQAITALQAAPVLEGRIASATQKNEPIAEDIIEPPRFGVSYLNNPAPDYPRLSRKAGEEGRVVMKVLVSAEGLADEVQIEKTSGSERLDNAAMDAVKKWRFIPAKKNNQPLSAYVLVPMKFSLDS
jgi:periplasmic protein TonB